ncbi:DNA-processing protein DprA [Nanoarchaeota archaeon]
MNIGTKSSNDSVREKLLEYGSFENIYKSLNPDVLSVGDSIRSIKGIEKVISTLDKVDFDFDVLTVNDSNFPESMKKEGNSPVIYTRGDKSLLNRENIAVVGTRHIYPNKDRAAYGEAFNVLKRLLEKDYVIVSGLAKGCDTLAHTKAVEAGKSTIAVLGTPLNQYYPSSNKKLQEIIAKEHLLVSQYPIGIRTFSSYFAHRNLTTVSLSTEGIVVIKASDKSGTQHAIKSCAEQDKPIYVLANNFLKNHNWLENYKENIKRINKK